MDHDTHTVAYEAGLTQATDISRGMEMLERRHYITHHYSALRRTIEHLCV